MGTKVSTVKTDFKAIAGERHRSAEGTSEWTYKIPDKVQQEFSLKDLKFSWKVLSSTEPPESGLFPKYVGKVFFAIRLGPEHHNFPAPIKIWWTEGIKQHTDTLVCLR